MQHVDTGMFQMARIQRYCLCVGCWEVLCCNPHAAQPGAGSGLILVLTVIQSVTCLFCLWMGI